MKTKEKKKKQKRMKQKQKQMKGPNNIKNVANTHCAVSVCLCVSVCRRKLAKIII